MNCCASKRLMQKPARHCEDMSAIARSANSFAKSSAHNSDHSHDASAEEGYSLEDSRPSRTIAKEE